MDMMDELKKMVLAAGFAVLTKPSSVKIGTRTATQTEMDEKVKTDVIGMLCYVW